MSGRKTNQMCKTFNYDRVAIIHDGKILGCDTIAGLKEATGNESLVDVFFQLIENYEIHKN